MSRYSRNFFVNSRTFSSSTSTRARAHYKKRDLFGYQESKLSCLSLQYIYKVGTRRERPAAPVDGRQSSDAVALLGDGVLADGVGVGLLLEAGGRYAGGAGGRASGAAAAGGGVAREEVVALAVEALHQEPLYLVLPHEDYEDDDALEGVGQVGHVPDLLRQLVLARPRYYLHQPVDAHHGEQLHVEVEPEGNWIIYYRSWTHYYKSSIFFFQV